MHKATIQRRSANSTIALTVKELCELYLNDLKAGLILGKGGRPKKPTTIVTDTGRIHRHILPLIGTRRVKDLVKADINKVLKDIMAGKTRASVKTKKLRGKAIVRGGVGTATRTVGLLGGILTYAIEAGIIETNPAHGIRKPKDRVRNRRLTEAEYRALGGILRKAAEDERYQMTTDIIRQIALTGSAVRKSLSCGGQKPIWRRAACDWLIARRELPPGQSGYLWWSFWNADRLLKPALTCFQDWATTMRLAVSPIIGRKFSVIRPWPISRRMC